MAIIFHSEKYSDIKIDSHIIIGITGYDYQSFLKGLIGSNIYYFENDHKSSNRDVSSIIGKDNNDKKLDESLKDLGLEDSFLTKNVNDLSHGEYKLFNYLRMFLSDKSIMVIDEPFLDLDYDNKKRIISLLKKLAKKKTIILGSHDTNIIYTNCKKVLLLGKKKCLYDDVTILSNKRILRQYQVRMPEIIEFIRFAKDKKIKLPYSKDIRDLIKDVFKNVSK